MRNECTRRTALKAVAGAACLAGTLAQAAPARRLKVGMTSINWGFRPEDAEPGIRDSAKLGYHGYEVFGDSIDPLQEQGGLKALLDKYNMPMPSGYLNINLHDPTVRAQQMENMKRWGKVLRECGSKIAVLGPMGVPKDYNFQAAKADVVKTLNEAAKVLSDLGLIAALHQHTRTAVDTEEQVYAVMEAVDTRYVKFGPDVAQLQNAGSDPLKICKDFLPLIYTVHLKDYLGVPPWRGYCPLGMGKVNLPAVIDLLETAPNMTHLMVELDRTRNAPTPPFECAVICKEYLMKQGYTFRS
ncbi:MAG TPA: sugar phosphate isomerase/epimerase family protein [Bryobacteraceae bacterium]|nr:sugar phosphate isomerase/epimerase family protein [Bryobacteraceae bacterium]HOL73197.1 sugar phosphate isomerase/epimerase family protein [Bryobacteraceae bacterium]HOQ45975.1 sugar phosphate isomerase/epimerase family protein [Bryobacteraceae bacterium]HPU73814.1 sugar phosphate isomerase/epimerase family protein [Bryobacteraceae bacterium]